MKKILFNIILIVLYASIGAMAYFLAIKFFDLSTRDAIFVGSGAFVFVLVVTETLAHRFHWNHITEPLSAAEFLEQTTLTSSRQISQAYKKQGGNEDIVTLLLSQTHSSDGK